MNPFDPRAVSLEALFDGWEALSLPASPHTPPHLCLARAVEEESAEALYRFSLSARDEEESRALATLRRLEKRQLAALTSALGGDVCAYAFACERASVLWTGEWLGRESEGAFCKALDFLLPEESDHLYRLANLMSLMGRPPSELEIGGLELAPGRPSVSQHRHPNDTVLAPLRASALDTRLGLQLTRAVERQSQRAYEYAARAASDERARALFRELALLEEQHVTRYASLGASDGWTEIALWQRAERFAYACCAAFERDEARRAVWERQRDAEERHLRFCLARCEADVREQLGGAELPPPVTFRADAQRVRETLRKRGEWTALRDCYAPVDCLTEDADFFRYQRSVNADASNTPSHAVCEAHIRAFGRDYRCETALSPMEALQSRVRDNVTLGRARRP